MLLILPSEFLPLVVSVDIAVAGGLEDCCRKEVLNFLCCRMDVILSHNKKKAGLAAGSLE